MNNAICKYQCPGCIFGPDTESCSEFKLTGKGCANYRSGTLQFGIGRIASGLPKGFNRFGPKEDAKFHIWGSYDIMIEEQPNLATKYSVPVWKHFDGMATIARYFSARTNVGWTEVILGDCRDNMPNAIEITKEDIEYMD